MIYDSTHTISLTGQRLVAQQGYSHSNKAHVTKAGFGFTCSSCRPGRERVQADGDCGLTFAPLK